MEEADIHFDFAYNSASRTFEDARRLVNQVMKVRGYFPIVGIGAYDGGFNSLTGNRTQAARGRATPRGGSSKGGMPRGSSRGSSTGKEASPPQQSASKLRKGGAPWQSIRGGPHHAARLTSGNCFLCRQPVHIAPDCPNKGIGSTPGQQIRRSAGGKLSPTMERTEPPSALILLS